MKKRLKNILNYKIMENLFQFSRQSWSNWKKENRPITVLIEKYFTNKDLQEFLDTGKISKFEVAGDKSLERKIEQLEQRITSLEDK